eukprot:PhM_4_TR7544/c0_g1_i1/m.40465/K05601/hcp; hydroxylamine reductase
MSRLVILYGSQTGTAENYSKMLSTTALSHGFVPQLATMNDGVRILREEGGKAPAAMVWVTSTYGSGEFPDNAQQMASAVESGSLDAVLKGVPFAVFGLGNRKNEHFNAAAKKLHAMVTKAGGAELTVPQYSCEVDGHDLAFRSFKQALWAALGSSISTGAVDTCVYDVVASTDTPAQPMHADFVKVKVSQNIQATAFGYPHATWFLKFDVPASVQTVCMKRSLLVNDWVDVQPQNGRRLVERACARLKLPPRAVYMITPKPGAAPSNVDKRAFSVDTLLTEIIDLSAIPSRSFLEALSVLNTVPEEKKLLDELANDLNMDSKFDKLSNGVFTIIDLLEMVPNVPITLALLLTHAPRLTARSYSIANALIETTGSPVDQSVELLYRIPIRSAEGKTHEGLCTSYLRELKFGSELSVRFHPSGIPVEPDTVPVCFIALSSGIGTVRALLAQRFQRNPEAARCRLYYSFRNTGKDQFFQDELHDMVSKEQIELINCPSHDTEKAKYLVEYFSRDITTFLGPKGHVHYCGAGGSVPSSVDYGLRRCGVDVSQLRAEDRYHEEFFTPDHDMENLLKSHTGGKVDGDTLASRMGKTEMFCFQCEQTRNGRGCTKVGVCGKTAEVAWLQDLTIHAVKRLGFFLYHLRKLGAPEDDAANHMTLHAAFTTLTNVNFDETRFQKLVEEVRVATEAAKARYEALCTEKGVKPLVCPGYAVNSGVQDIESLVEKGKAVGVLTRFTDPDTQSAAGVCEMLMYGLKGIAAYSDHALMNKMEDKAIYEFMHEALAALCDPSKVTLEHALKLCLEAGKANVTTMALLYKSHTTLGVPTPTSVPVAPVPGKCILVSGHDLIILRSLLEQTEPLGINVYTHGEMLPAHSYPELKKHKNLVGNFGGAWMRQSVEFPHFPGAILMTTNCLTSPGTGYRDRLFTAGAVGWKNIPHIGNTLDDIDFKPVIEATQRFKGFLPTDTAFTYSDQIGTKRPKEIMVGFGHEAILGAAPTIVEQIKKGNITRFFLVGGCDGYEGERSYYTELVRNLPKTCVILTVGCGKYRINHLELGTIGDTGLPRLLDLGQCNDSFSAVQVATALASVLGCEIKDLPLSIVLSWFEQKAIAVLLSCLSLGLKPIHVGPSLPAFLTPDVLEVLVRDFGIRVLGDPIKDMEEMLAAKGAS